MLKKIAVIGKGGSGKSVIVSLITKILIDEHFDVLTIDTDESNTGLYRMLGVPNRGKALVEFSSSGAYIMREFDKKSIGLKDIPQEYLSCENSIKLLLSGKINTSFQGCACTMGSVVKTFLGKLKLKNNEIVVVDTEAGLEHFGRGLEKYIDTIFIVIEPSFESIEVADKAILLAREIGVSNINVIINKVHSDDELESLQKCLKSRNIPFVGVVRFDSKISEECFIGTSLGNSQAKKEVRDILLSLLGKSKN